MNFLTDYPLPLLSNTSCCSRHSNQVESKIRKLQAQLDMQAWYNVFLIFDSMFGWTFFGGIQLGAYIADR